MAGSFVSPSQPTAKEKSGKPNRPRRTAEGIGLPPKPEYPLTDSFASREIPGFAARRRKNNGKSGWNTVPARVGHTGFATREAVASPERGRGKTVGKDS